MARPAFVCPARVSAAIALSGLVVVIPFHRLGPATGFSGLIGFDLVHSATGDCIPLPAPSPLATSVDLLHFLVASRSHALLRVVTDPQVTPRVVLGSLELGK